MSGDNGRETPPPRGGPKGPLKDELRPPLPKRFYREVAVAVADDGAAFTVLLDGRPLRTPLKRALAVASREIAERIAAEWQQQVGVIDPSSMPATRLVNSAIDGVAGRAAEVIDDIARYASSDLLCYRAEGPRGLVARQDEEWEPILVGVERRLPGRFLRVAGVIHTAQPAETVAQVKSALTGRPPLALAALHVITTLTGSAILALALAWRHVTPEAAWAAAHVDEDWQISQWGEDAEAALRRRLREAEFLSAAGILAETT